MVIGLSPSAGSLPQTIGASYVGASHTQVGFTLDKRRSVLLTFIATSDHGAEQLARVGFELSCFL
jgi:hypothetical protein